VGTLERDEHDQRCAEAFTEHGLRRWTIAAITQGGTGNAAVSNTGAIDDGHGEPGHGR
jgi:hypothetical protein